MGRHHSNALVGQGAVLHAWLVLVVHNSTAVHSSLYGVYRNSDYVKK
jgi:hypothetical protein